MILGAIITTVLCMALGFLLGMVVRWGEPNHQHEFIGRDQVQDEIARQLYLMGVRAGKRGGIPIPLASVPSTLWASGVPSSPTVSDNGEPE